MKQVDLVRAEQEMRHFQIPASPTVLLEVHQLSASVDSDADDYAYSIGRDVALSGMLLKTINSPIFGLKRKILDIEQAIVMLGIKRVEMLVTYIELRRAMSGKACISLEKFWDNSIDLANLMLMLPGYLNIKNPSLREDCFTFGLFRDCGIPLMAMRFSDYKETLIKANNQIEIPFTEVEDEIYQTNHAVVGYFLANSWHLPDYICELILRHHDDELLPADDVSAWSKDLYAMSKIAANIHSRYRYGQENSEWVLEKENVLTRLHMSDLDYQELEQDVIDEFKIRFK
ncbi:HDOD domain-containing protein [Methylophaga sp. OBS3]|uniref:HDOD domain-containing protein n=1 Tax=Methylophaga sp. OBS3 TaxID=2991934 RepID=UPI002258F5F5|nr:HDOD domain-containing protein [Methylophaga sp. OBS3]MCX4190006.1 HDOD domain-containing protein [Methylophaga sp. OBS3]